MSITRQKPMWQILAVLVVAAAIGGTSLPALAAPEWIESPVKVTIYKVSTGEEFTATVQGLFKNEDGDDSIKDDTLYLPIEAIFSADGIAGRAGATWAVNGGSVSFPVANSVRSVDITVVNGGQYVPALESLAKLGYNRGLADQSHLTVTIW